MTLPFGSVFFLIEIKLKCNCVIQTTATGPDTQRSKASECRGGQRGFGEEAMRLLMKQKKKKRQRDFGGEEGMNLLSRGGAHIQRATTGGVRCGGGRGG